MTSLKLLAALLLFATAAAGAQTRLADPTRPPAAAEGGEAAPGGATAKPSLRLQSVLISNTRKLAVIDGQTVPLGGEIGGATLTSVSETGVTLRRGAEIETLKLHPDVEKKQGGSQ